MQLQFFSWFDLDFKTEWQRRSFYNAGVLILFERESILINQNQAMGATIKLTEGTVLLKLKAPITGAFMFLDYKQWVPESSDRHDIACFKEI